MQPVATSLDERRLLRALRAGDEEAFAALHRQYDASLVALARSYGCSSAVAQEVVQDTWAAVVRGIHSFEGRAALKTWIYRILVNAATAQARRERRSVPADVVDLEQARSRRTAASPEEELVLRETVEHVHTAIESLAPAQREVITLRDVQGWSAEDVSDHLGISRGNQRVLLHRARAQVRRAVSEAA